MKAILDILISLGLDNTVFIQFGIFIVMYLFLDFVVFRPYLNAYKERRKRTVDSGDVTKDLRLEIESLEADYAKDAKELNSLVKKEFDEKRQQAQKQTVVIIGEAQKKAQEKVKAGKATIEQSYSAAREQLKQFVPDLGTEIKQRLLER